jgi:hypothetical protein
MRPVRASWYALTLAVSLLLPWRLGERARTLSGATPAVLFAVFHVVLGALLSVLLSSWTYLAGKGLVLGPDQMDLGADDLPFDSVGQVLIGLSGAGLCWSLLFFLVGAVCLLVADRLYSTDRVGFRTAGLSAALATPWLVVGAAAMLVVNGVLRDELFHPAAAIRAYAQLRQKGWPPGVTLTVRDRALWLGAVFPVVWASTLWPPTGRPRSAVRSFRFALLAVAACWLVWWALLRALPWAAIEALAG